MQKALEAAVIRMAGSGAQSLPGRRTGAERAAGFGPGEPLRIPERLRAAGFRQRRHGHRRGAGGLARRVPPDATAWRCDTLCLGPAYTAAEIKQVLENCKLRFRYLLTDRRDDPARPWRS